MLISYIEYDVGTQEIFLMHECMDIFLYIINYFVLHSIHPSFYPIHLHDSHFTSKVEISVDPGQLRSQLIWLLFVWLDSLRPSQQFLSHIRMGLPGLNLLVLILSSG